MHKYPYEAQQEINDLERQLAEARGLLMHTQRRVHEVKDFVNNGQLVTKYCNALCESIEDHLKEKGE